MGNIPSASTKSVFQKNVTISDGTNSYVEAKNWRWTFNYVINQETVIGTALPVQGTGEFRGEFEMEVLGSTDDTTHGLLEPGANGQIPETTWTITEGDSAGGSRVWTVKVRVNSYEESGSEDDFSRYRIRGVMTTPATHGA